MKHIDEDDDVFDEHGILKDGRSYRVSLRLADSLQREIANHARRRSPVTDGSGGSLGLHRPGFRVVNGAARDAIRNAREALYQSYDAAIPEEYKNPASQSALRRGTRESDAGTGRNTRRQNQDTSDVAAAYRDYDEYVSNAWRGPSYE